MRRPITITRTATAGWSGPITDRAGSAAIARGITITGATTIGIIAIGDLEGFRVAEMNQAPEGAPDLRKEISPPLNPNS
jgi:hypothetical protein